MNMDFDMIFTYFIWEFIVGFLFFFLIGFICLIISFFLWKKRFDEDYISDPMWSQIYFGFFKYFFNIIESIRGVQKEETDDVIFSRFFYITTVIGITLMLSGIFFSRNAFLDMTYNDIIQEQSVIMHNERESGNRSYLLTNTGKLYYDDRKEFKKIEPNEEIVFTIKYFKRTKVLVSVEQH